MGFNKVYRALQEIFPMIDPRALRAVSIEHSKDVNAAVDAVFAEVIPFFTMCTKPNISSSGSMSVGGSSGGANSIIQTADSTPVNAATRSTDGQNSYIANVEYQESFGDTNDGNNEPFRDTDDKYPERSIQLTLDNNPSHTLVSLQGKDVESSCLATEFDSTFNKDSGQGKTSGDCNTCGVSLASFTVHGPTASLSDNNLPLLLVNEKSGSDSQELDVNLLDDATSEMESISNIANADDDESTLHGPVSKPSHIHMIDGLAKIIADAIKNKSGSDLQELDVNLFDDATSEMESISNIANADDDESTLHGPVSKPSHIHMIDGLAKIIADASKNKSGSDLQELDVNLLDDATSEMESISNIANADDDESTLHGPVSQPSHIHMIDGLAKIIADARKNKKLLFTAMNSVISLMREVELEEKAAEEARVETDMGDTDILVKSAELDQLVKQAEEFNSTRAAEMYGERAILATELRELQSRALYLSAERDKYLAVLVEMQKKLALRFAEAQNVIKSAEQEKMEKKKCLAEQDSIMFRVLQESKFLNQQAEDNAKLREFLVDRGHVVDTLQGEISAICQDVRLLKENFDEHVSFSKALTSSHTSFILASSGSSSKSLIPEQVESLPDDRADDSLDSQEKGGVNYSPTDHTSQVEAAMNDHKSLSDDDWEIFDYDISS